MTDTPAASNSTPAPAGATRGPVLVTGGSGLIGAPTVAALVRRGHHVRIFSRGAEEEARTWPAQVQAVSGSIADQSALDRASAGCEAVIHLAAIVSEEVSGESFEEVNVQGTQRALAAANKAGVERFIFVSSLGAERGQSPYQQSKRRAEELVREFGREWLIVRPGNVYGPGDEVISLLLKMVRVLPVVPAIDGGDHQFQPIFVEDLAEALALAVERRDIARCALDVAGPDVTTMNDLIDRFKRLTDRSPLRVPVPGFLSVLGARGARMLGLNAPLDAGQVQMLEEGSRIERAQDNALTTVLGLKPTPLDEGLQRLTDALPELPLDRGVGSLVRRHVWAEIQDSKLSAEELFERFRSRFSDITPWHVQVGAEPNTPDAPELGRTLTMHLPLRGNVQVRVVELSKSSLTLATIEGHPLAGIVRFRVEAAGRRLVFHVEVHDRPGNIADWLVMSTVGGALQVATWRSTVQEVVNESGGRAVDGVHEQSERLRGAAAKEVEDFAASLIEARKESLHEDGRTDSSEESPRAS